MNFYDQAEICKYLNIFDLYNLHQSGCFSFSEVFLQEKEKSLTDYEKLKLFYNYPDESLEIFSLRNILNKIFIPLKPKEICEFFSEGVLPEYSKYEKDCYRLVMKIFFRYPALACEVDPKIFLSLFFIKDFKYKEIIFDDVLTSLRTFYPKIYEKYGEPLFKEYYRYKKSY